MTKKTPTCRCGSQRCGVCLRSGKAAEKHAKVRRYDDIQGQTRVMERIVRLQDELEIAPRYLRDELRAKIAVEMANYREFCGRGWVE